MHSEMSEPVSEPTAIGDATRRAALVALIAATLTIAIGYAAAFFPGGTPAWAPWLLALGIPTALGAIMILGAARGQTGIGALKYPFAFVVAGAGDRLLRRTGASRNRERAQQALARSSSASGDRGLWYRASPDHNPPGRVRADVRNANSKRRGCGASASSRAGKQGARRR